MNTLNLNIEKCQRQVEFRLEKLDNTNEKILEYSSSRAVDKKAQEAYEFCCQIKKWNEEDLKGAQKALDEAWKLQNEVWKYYWGLIR